MLDNHFSFTQDTREWTDTQVLFEIVKVGRRTRVDFAHLGLVPSFECSPVCHDGWTTFLGSLQSFIETGEGRPHRGEARTASEAALQG